MKNQTAYALAALAIVGMVYLWPKSTNKASKVKAIPNTAKPGQEGYGWQYFTDGTTIGPDGTYYAPNGSTVYIPDAAQVGPTWTPVA